MKHSLVNFSPFEKKKRIPFVYSIDEHINGKAFRDLTDDNLKELGFRMGARINIKGIISSIAVSHRIDFSQLSVKMCLLCVCSVLM